MDLNNPTARAIVDRIDRAPAELKHWRDLMMLCFDLRDGEAFTSYQVIVDSLNQFHGEVSRANSGSESGPRLSQACRRALMQLARDPLNRDNLKICAEQFIEPIGLADSAKKFIDRALQLYPEDPEFQQLQSAASRAAVDRPTKIGVAEPEAEQPSVDNRTKVLKEYTRRHRAPRASKMIRQTARLLPDFANQLKQRKLGVNQSQLPNYTTEPADPESEAALDDPGADAMIAEIDALTKSLSVDVQRVETEEPPTGVIDARPPDHSRAKVSTGEIENLHSKLHSLEGKLNNLQAENEQLRAENAQKELTEQSLDSKMNEVRQLLRQDRLDEAYRLSEEIINEDSSFQTAWIIWDKKGSDLYNRGELEKAITLYGKSVALKPTYADAWFNLAATLHELGQKEMALDAYNKVVEIQPMNSRAWCNLGALYYESGDVLKTVDACRRAVEAKPDYAKAWDNLGMALTDLEMLEEAAEAFSQAVVLKPKSADLLFKLGSIYYQLEQISKADEAFDQVVTRQEDHWLAWCYLAMTQAKLGELDVAREICDKIHRENPECELLWTAWNEVGLAVSREKDHLGAAEIYMKVVEIKPDVAEVWCNLGVALEKSEQYDGAIKSYRRAVQLKPELAGAWQSLGLAHYRLRNMDQSVEAFEEVTRLTPDDPSAWYDLGVMYEKMNRMRDAANTYLTALKLKPDHVLAWNNVGLIHLSQEQYGNAAAVFERVTKLKPDYSKAWYNLGVVRHRMNSLPNAIESFAKAIEMDPHFVEAWEYMASVLHQEGRVEEAQTALTRAHSLREAV